MRAANARRPLLHVAAVTAGLTSGAVHAGAEWRLTPSATASARTQKNPYLRADEQSRDATFAGFSTQASLDMTRETERLSLALQPNLAVYRFPDQSDLDRNEGHLNASMSWRGETSSWGGNVSIARDTTLTSELGNTGLTEGNRRHESYDVSLGPTWQLSERMSAQARIESLVNRYPGRASATLENYRYDSGLVSMSYLLSDRAVVSVSGSAGRLNSKGQGDHSDNASVMVRAQYAWSPVWSIGVGAGPSLTRLASSSEHGVVYSASLSRSFERAALSLDVSRGQQPSGSAIITDTEQANLSFNAVLTERLSGAVAASYIRRRNALRDFNVDLTRVRYTRLEASLAWRVSPSWQIGGGISDSIQQTQSFLFNDQTGRGYEAHLSVSWNGNPYVH